MMIRLITFIFIFFTFACGTLKTAQLSTAQKFSGLGSYHALGQGDIEESDEEAIEDELEVIPPPVITAPGYKPQAKFSLQWPVKHIRINQRFNPWKKKRAHQGIDLGGSKTSDILAAHEGVVIYAGRGFKGYGKMVLVEYDDQWATLYAHLSKILVKTGESVGTGHVLGKMGRTGRATGVHLHFELLHNKQPIDPLLFLPEIDRVSLLKVSED